MNYARLFSDFKEYAIKKQKLNIKQFRETINILWNNLTTKQQELFHVSYLEIITIKSKQINIQQTLNKIKIKRPI